MNKVILMGRLTRDPMVSYSQGESSMAVARFTLAVDRRVRRDANNSEQQTADFIGCVAFGKTAEFVEKYFHQGTKMVLEGHIQTGSYTNKEGQRVYTTDVIVDNVEFAESKNAASNNNNGGYQPNGGYQASGNYQQSAPAGRPAPAAASVDGFMNIPDGVEDEGLPFN
jgi:single-strand DNA-binding protein